MSAYKKIGIISDTHGPLLTPVFDIFESVDAIIHAGDFGSPGPVEELEALAPVYGVSGNVDGFDITHRFPQKRIVNLGGVNFYIQHIINDPVSHYLRLKRDPLFSVADIVVFGHSHVPIIDHFGRYLYINPGSAKEPRVVLNPSVAIVIVDDGVIKESHIESFNL